MDANAPMEAPKDALEDVVEDIIKTLDQPTKFILKILLNTLYGFTSPHIMKVHGYFKGQLLIILLDLGSTHNFFYPNMAKKTHSYIYYKIILR